MGPFELYVLLAVQQSGETMFAPLLSNLRIRLKKRATTMTQLRHLDLQSCRKITDASLSAISTMTQLQHLDLCRCDHITDEGLIAMSTLTQLQRLHLRYCENITHIGLSAILSQTQLQYLDLYKCRNLKGAGCYDVSTLPQLKRVNLTGCSIQRWLNKNQAASVDECMIKWTARLGEASTHVALDIEKLFEFVPF